MNKSQRDGRNDIWGRIDDEKKNDLRLRRVIIAAWSVVILMVFVYGVFTLLDVTRAWALWASGAMSYSDVIDRILPLIIVIGTVSLLIAILSTIGAFLRSRTATLGEIRLRLAALESILRAEPDERT